MSERYCKLFSLPENLYAEGSPVIIAAGALLKDNQTGRVIAQLKLCNINPKTIKAATVSLSLMNTVGNPLGESVRYEYLDLSSTRDTDFGSKSAIPLPDASTRSFSVAVAEVIFADNSVWNANGATWETLKNPETLTSRLDSEMVKQFRIEYGSGAKNFFLEQKDLWYCVCGAVNRREEKTCHSCRKSICDLMSIDLDALEALKERRLIREREQAEKEAAAVQERREAAIKTAQKAGKITAIAAFLIIIVIISVVKIPPIIRARQEEKARLNAYNSAIALIDAKQYDEAIAVLQELADYKDSAQQIQIAEKGKQEMLNADAYTKAVALLEEKNYEGAISVFSALGQYRDSANLLIESRYQYALESMRLKDYGKATGIFTGLDDYADSKEMACECEYLRAMELIGQEDYLGAYSALQTIPEYKDAAEFLSHMYMVPQKIIQKNNLGHEYSFYFGYNSDGKMNEAREVAGTSSWTFSFSEDGVLAHSYYSSGERFRTYVTTSNGLVTSYYDGEANARYDEHGNKIAYWLDLGYHAEWHEYTGREYDEHANRIDHSTNIYGAAGDHQEMNLQSVRYSEGNLVAQSSFSYTYLYLPNEEADMDLIWKNIRIICGDEIWG